MFKIVEKFVNVDILFGKIVVGGRIVGILLSMSFLRLKRLVFKDNKLFMKIWLISVFGVRSVVKMFLVKECNVVVENM